jgi:glycolate oxidase FAD binding subunit
MPDLVTEWAEHIRDAGAKGTPLMIRGGGTKDFYGARHEGATFATTHHTGIIDYEPTELVLTARCGTPLAEIESALAQHGQMLAFEPPHFGATATLGGTVATGLSGPRRMSAGSARDFVLGVRVLDGRGQDLRFGGKVIKNVAGFDVSRLMVGALGTLGVILDVSLKVLPMPPRQHTICLDVGEQEAIRLLNEWAARPLPISATCHLDGRLLVRLAGTAAGVAAAARQLGGTTVDTQEEFWTSVREHTHQFFAGDDPLWRLAVASTSPVLPLAGKQLIEWNGALRWLMTDADPPLVRDVARKAGGHATLFRRGTASVDTFHPLEPGLKALHKRLKQVFDPAHILNPGRLYPDL